MTNNFTLAIGYTSSSVVSYMHFQDIILAFMIGFVGSAGAYLFKYLVDKIKKGKD
jgi:capsular polysaccharide biosynthesis protein